tara:strand:+ start:7016 stop:7381 length:366 start_codon:yes stop_codon:yes gene_type:complete
MAGQTHDIEIQKMIQRIVEDEEVDKKQSLHHDSTHHKTRADITAEQKRKEKEEEEKKESEKKKGDDSPPEYTRDYIQWVDLNYGEKFKGNQEQLNRAQADPRVQRAYTDATGQQPVESGKK